MDMQLYLLRMQHGLNCLMLLCFNKFDFLQINTLDQCKLKKYQFFFCKITFLKGNIEVDVRSRIIYSQLK
jgi:hypothetical protein